MSARDSLLVALPAVLLGLALGYFLSEVLETADQSVEASLPTAATPNRPQTTEGSSAPASVTQVGNDRTPLTAVPRQTPKVTQAEFNTAAAGVTEPLVEARAGAGQITGMVYDESGAPLAGAVVEARANIYNPISPPDSVGECTNWMCVALAIICSRP